MLHHMDDYPGFLMLLHMDDYVGVLMLQHMDDYADVLMFQHIDDYAGFLMLQHMVDYAGFLILQHMDDYVGFLNLVEVDFIEELTKFKDEKKYSVATIDIVIYANNFECTIVLFEEKDARCCMVESSKRSCKSSAIESIQR